MSDPILQSLPLSYVAVEAASNDGSPHHVQLYLDITGGTLVTPAKSSVTHVFTLEWLSDNNGDMMTWSTSVTNPAVFHQLALQTLVPFGTKSGQSADATMWHGMLNTAVRRAVPTVRASANTTQTRAVTYMADSDPNCRGQFNLTGSLKNTVNSPPKVISEYVAYLCTMRLYKNPPPL